MASKPWSEVNAIYQIYPRSFKDSNSDGIGDLRGVIEKLDYIHGQKDSLGIDAIWFSPIFSSPMADMGYDVSNYCDIDTLFGTLDDFKELVDKAHERNINVMIDFVPNHTSNQHPWFLASRKDDKITMYGVTQSETVARQITGLVFLAALHGSGMTSASSIICIHSSKNSLI